MSCHETKKNEVIVLGGGLTGLSAGYVLSMAGLGVKVFESDSSVGGLSKTIVHNGFRFDLGGHRFFTKNKKINDFVKNLMEEELIFVPRKSKIYMRNKYFDYPLKPLNAIFGLGIPATLKIMYDYGVQRVKRLIKEPGNISLEDWVISNFGRKMFDIYFKEYSEKVWGIECSRISAEWVAQRIRGLSLAKAIKNAFFKFNGKDVPTLVDEFLYPQLGIGRISDRLKEEIERNNDVCTEARAERINHSNFKIDSVEIRYSCSRDSLSRNRDSVLPDRSLVREEKGALDVIYGKEFISSIPVTNFIRALNPPPPEQILKAASKLRFRDIVIVAIMIDRKRITDQTWIYIPEQKIPFGRMHEPANWSEKMAPEGKTLVVVEFFSFAGDEIWNKSDEQLTSMTAQNLENLGFIKRDEVIDSIVVRAAKAYPLFEVGYKEICGELYDYLGRFENLHLAGRSGMFRYYNMDHAIESGIDAAEKIIKKMQDTGYKIHDKENFESCIVQRES